MDIWPTVVIARRDFDAPSASSYWKAEADDSDATVNNDRGALSQRLGEALRGFFPKLASWFETSTDRARRRQIEAFLSHATDIADLEDRMRQVQRREIFFHYN